MNNNYFHKTLIRVLFSIGIMFTVGIIVAGIKYQQVGLETLHTLDATLINSIVFFVSGCLLMIPVVYKILYNAEFYITGEKVNGKVIDVKLYFARHATYKPSIQYSTLGGKTLIGTTNIGSNPPNYKIGQEVKLYYNPKNPEHILVKNFSDQWLLALTFGSIGTIFMVMSLYIL